ncbi:hypothetical protein [Natronomonas gomsonensis]|uniref:DUF7857 domain-containing protein n=1 Tax=Natronomonas gomsonensis TaxID=1046043 RepID=UPI0015BE3B43|nr:hypothetical protein [Natronomonas gomsonensis]
MPTLRVESTRVDGVTFVEVLVTADRPHRIRIESRLDGPVFPPRSEGTPADGWNERGVTRTVDTGTTPLGFATPARPERPVVELVKSEPLAAGGPPEAFAAWFERIERRVERAERLAAVEDLQSATIAIASVGGLDAVEELAAALVADERALARLSVAPEDLQRRVESVDLPTETFAGLARER